MNRVALIRILSLVVLVGVWEAIAQAKIVVSAVFPAPSDVLLQGMRLLQDETLWMDAYVSVYEIAVGLLVAAGFGLAAGALIGSSRYIYELVEPLIYYFGAVPKIVLLPLFILFLGVGIESKIGLGAISAFFPIVVNTSLAIREIRPIYIRVGQSFGASRFNLYKSVYTPAVLGPVLSGVRLGLGVAITATLLAETKVAQAGLGFRAIELYSQLRVAEMYALLVLIFTGAALINFVFGYFIARATRHQAQTARGTVSVA